jgi:hypothetical protein
MAGTEIEIAIAGGAFFGAVLGRFFKVLALIPASVILIALFLAKRGIAAHTWLDCLRGIGLLIASLELGYVTGLISTYIFPGGASFSRIFGRSPPHGAPRSTRSTRPRY